MRAICGACVVPWCFVRVLTCQASYEHCRSGLKGALSPLLAIGTMKSWAHACDCIEAAGKQAVPSPHHAADDRSGGRRWLRRRGHRGDATATATAAAAAEKEEWGRGGGGGGGERGGGGWRQAGGARAFRGTQMHRPSNNGSSRTRQTTSQRVAKGWRDRDRR